MQNLDQARSRPGGKVHDRNRPGGPKQINKKRQAKNSKFGFGGNKRLAKQNDAYSSADMEGYRGPGKASGGKFGKGKVRMILS